MLLGSRFLRLSAAVAGGVRRSLTTAASHPPWAMMRFSSEVVGAPSVDVRLAEPPRISEIRVPEHLVKTCGGSPDPTSHVHKLLTGATSGGLLFLTYLDLRSMAPIVGKQGPPGPGPDPAHVPGVTRFVCNPVTRELSRLPDTIFEPVQDVVLGAHMGFITQADHGHGPPDRFVAAKVGVGQNPMIRFLSEREEWEFVEVFPSQSLRPMQIDQGPLAFGGRLLWVDLT
uniref:Uncharacterized protein n=1 Tax=Avena sativa TaxID=4498 RepID=A0ACD5T9Q7_AVESA